MIQENKHHEFETYQWVARDVASRLSKRFDRPYEELLDVAEFALIIELYHRRKFQEQKGTKLSSWLWRVVYFYLLEVITRGKHPRQDDLSETPATEIPLTNYQSNKGGEVETNEESHEELEPVFRPHWLDNLLQELSEEGRVLVRTIVEAPEEIAHEFMPHRGRPSTKRQMTAVRSYLVDRLDWDWRTFHRAYREVEACL